MCPYSCLNYPARKSRLYCDVLYRHSRSVWLYHSSTLTHTRALFPGVGERGGGREHEMRVWIFFYKSAHFKQNSARYYHKLTLSCLVCNCCWLAVCIVVVILCVFVVLCVYCCFYFRCRTAGYKSVLGRSCDRPPRHKFFLVSLCL